MSKKNIITHRLVSINGDLYEFRGDNNPISDGLKVHKEDIVYHYTGHKIKGIGSFVLYAQSIFGIWSLLGIVGIATASEVVCYKIEKINKGRDKELSGEVKDEK